MHFLSSNLCQRLYNEFIEVSESVVAFLPGTMGRVFRRFLYKYILKNCGHNCKFGKGLSIQFPCAVSLGANCQINDYVWIAANSKHGAHISIGNDVLIGPFALLHSGNHNYSDCGILIRNQGHRAMPITVEDDCWIAARAVILSGVTLGRGTVVAAGAVVTRSTPPYSVIAGVPARIIGHRHSPDFTCGVDDAFLCQS